MRCFLVDQKLAITSKVITASTGVPSEGKSGKQIDSYRNTIELITQLTEDLGSDEPVKVGTRGHILVLY